MAKDLDAIVQHLIANMYSMYWKFVAVFPNPVAQPAHIVRFTEEPFHDVPHGIEDFIVRDWLLGN